MIYVRIIIVIIMKYIGHFFIIFFLLLALVEVRILISKTDIGNIKISDKIDNETKTVDINIIGDKSILKTECSLDKENWINTINGKCSFNLKEGTYTVYVKNRTGEFSKYFDVKISDITDIKVNFEKYYLAINEKVKLKTDIEYIGNPNRDIVYISKDEKIATIDENGIITGIGSGETDIIVRVGDYKEKNIKIIVTDLIEAPKINLNKPILPCEVYTEEEAKLLDEILESRVKIKGEGTRAALLEVLRFIGLNFKYRVPYFYEHGRLITHYDYQNQVDGEGRYYHKGMYLSKNKYDEIKYVHEDKKMWGCNLTNYDTTDGWAFGAKKPNGLDCSGFITWALYNSGIDTGDVGAGITPEAVDLSDFGTMHTLTYEFANSNEYKVGDFIAFWGHAALIAGKDDTNLYVAESLLRGVRIVPYNYKDKNSKLYKIFTFINTFDDVYTADGDYTDMWLE